MKKVELAPADEVIEWGGPLGFYESAADLCDF